MVCADQLAQDSNVIRDKLGKEKRVLNPDWLSWVAAEQRERPQLLTGLLGILEPKINGFCLFQGRGDGLRRFGVAGWLTGDTWGKIGERIIENRHETRVARQFIGKRVHLGPPVVIYSS